MRRTKEWWAALKPWERSQLMTIEKNARRLSGLGGYLPDDCGECPNCSEPVVGGGLCDYCFKELETLIRKANAAIAPMFKRPVCPCCHDTGLMRAFDVKIYVPVEWIGFQPSSLHRRETCLSYNSDKIKWRGDFAGAIIHCGRCGYMLTEAEAMSLNDNSIPSLKMAEGQ